MRRFRTMAQRRRRARAGQVAAVATVLGLMLVVTFLSNYLASELPALVTAAEIDHVLLVEDQMARLQATVLAQARSIDPALPLISPITLGSAAVPPFGGPSTGSIAPTSSGSNVTASYAVGTISYDPPRWGAGSSCLSGGSGTCRTTGATDSWNETGRNRTTFSINIQGASNTLYYNLSGNNDTLHIRWTGADTHQVYVLITGSDDTVIYTRSGADSAGSQASLAFYGERDVFDFNPSGSRSTGSGMVVDVSFSGMAGSECSYADLAQTDRIGSLATGGNDVNLSVIWYNSVGIASGPSAQSYPGGGALNETIHWSNETGSSDCPYEQRAGSSFVTTGGEGIRVTLFNQELPTTTLSYNEGAVILDEVGAAPVMISPPNISFAATSAGVIASVTVVNLVGQFTTEVGTLTAAVSTRVLASTHATFADSVQNEALTSPLFLNVTTRFPLAWQEFLGSLGAGDALVTWCTPLAPLPTGSTCLDPPSGALEELTAEIAPIELSLTEINIDDSLE